MRNPQKSRSEELSRYAMKILLNHGCSCYTYYGEAESVILDDLKAAYPNGMEYPYIEVANEIRAMSRALPIYRYPYHVEWNTDVCCDAYGAESLEEAQNRCLECFMDWAEEEQKTWEDVENPTEDDMGNWNYMYENFWAYVAKYNPETDEYEEVWTPDDNDLLAIGWHSFEEYEE